MDLAMRQGYGACALPLCGGGRLLRRRSETDRFLFFFSIFIFFVVFFLFGFTIILVAPGVTILPPEITRRAVLFGVKFCLREKPLSSPLPSVGRGPLR